MDTGKPVRKASGGRAGHVAESWMRRPAAGLLSGACKLLLPLNARGATLGYIVCTRKRGSQPFDAYDTEIGMEFAVGGGGGYGTVPPGTTHCIGCPVTCAMKS
jgi:hypothetical protein